MDLSSMQLAPRGAPKSALEAIGHVPADVRAFLARHDGGRGKLGTRPFVLWSADEIGRESESQEVVLATPGLVLFGTDGGAMGYGHFSRLRARRYGRIPLIAAGPHEFEGLADSLEDLLQAIADGR